MHDVCVIMRVVDVGHPIQGSRYHAQNGIIYQPAAAPARLLFHFAEY